jgi:hypothetical protein
LAGNRAIDIQGAQQNRADQINALGAAQGFTGNTLNQAIQGYGTNLQGLAANQGEQLQQLNSIYQPYQLQAQLLGQQAQTQQGAIGQGLQQQGLGLQGQSIANQFNLGTRAQDLANNQFDFSKFNTNRQFDYNAGQDAAAASRQWDMAALNYQQGQDQNYNSLLEYMLGGGQ